MAYEWVHEDWQLVDAEGDHWVVGLTWGTGLLDERVEDTGALALALTALRDALARPVELAPGITGLPEVNIDLDTDTCTLQLRGRPEAVRAAWERLPALFVASTLTGVDEVGGLAKPVWPTDSVQRTGANSHALAYLHVTPDDVRERAAAALTFLDPSLGVVPRVFFSSTPELVTWDAGPVRAPRAPAPAPTAWPDGTPRWDPATNVGQGNRLPNRPGTVAEPEIHQLFSVLVPRTSAGIAAAQLVRSQLQAALHEANGGTPSCSLRRAAWARRCTWWR